MSFLRELATEPGWTRLAARMRSILPQYDSIQEFEQARHDRLWDGLTLWSEGHADSAAGAAYLLGYTVEMALK